jgi:hypothetical protein
VTKKQFGQIQKGAALQIPLTLWNTIFKCEECHYWNWVILDDRITGFEMTCPDCGKVSAIESLGRHLEFAKGFWGRIVIGELRQQSKPVVLPCGHSLYLPTLLLESQARPGGEPPTPAADAPIPESSPTVGTEKKKTQPIPIFPPPK